MNPIWPLIVIGAGPAGFMADITTVERCINALSLERKTII